MTTRRLVQLGQNRALLRCTPCVWDNDDLNVHAESPRTEAFRALSFAQKQRVCLVGPGMPSDGLTVGDRTLYLNEFRYEFFTCPTCLNVETEGRPTKLIFLDAPNLWDAYDCPNCRDGGLHDSRNGEPSDLQQARAYPDVWEWSQMIMRRSEKILIIQRIDRSWAAYEDAVLAHTTAPTPFEWVSVARNDRPPQHFMLGRDHRARLMGAYLMQPPNQN